MGGAIHTGGEFRRRPLGGAGGSSGKAGVVQFQEHVPNKGEAGAQPHSLTLDPPCPSGSSVPRTEAEDLLASKPGLPQESLLQA